MDIKTYETLYQTYHLNDLYGVIWGHQVSKGHFHEKCFDTIF